MICLAPLPTLAELFRDAYKPERLVGRSPRTIECYVTALSLWGRFSGDSTINQIDSRLIARFQEHLLPGRKAASVNAYVRPIMALLRFAADDEQIDRPPRMRKLRELKQMPLALTTEEFQAVLTTAEKFPGRIGWPWWKSLLLTDWETGLRRSALLSIASRNLFYDPPGIMCQAEPQKDREAAWFPLPLHVMEAVEEIYSPTRELIWECGVNVDTVGRWFRKILDKSGIHAPKGCGMAFHRIRRGTASYTKVAGGNAQVKLGHSAPSVTERYFDPRIIGVPSPVWMPKVL